MKKESIKAHLKAYSIVKKRSSTVANAFASAIAPRDDYDDALVKEALLELKQEDLDNLICVYCSGPAETWDHLTNLVKDKQLNGLGHQIRNLVPCCKKCNSSKRGDSHSKYIDTLAKLSKGEKTSLKSRLTRYLNKATPVDSTTDTKEVQGWLKDYKDTQGKVLAAFEKADRLAEKIHKARKAANHHSTRST